MNDVMKIYEQLQGEWKKRVKPHKCLGLAISEDGLAAAEIIRRKEEFSLGQKARFGFPEDASFERPGQLGEALKQFLKGNGFTARKAVVGIPAKWVMTREVILPPSSESAISGVMKIRAEQEFSLGPEDLVLDYTGVVHPDRPSRLVLCAMLKKRMLQIQEAVQGAGMELLSISVASIPLFCMGQTADPVAGARFGLFMRRAYTVLLERTGEETVGVKYFQKREDSGRNISLVEVGRVLSEHMKSVPDGGEEKVSLWCESEDLKEDAADFVAGLPKGMSARNLPVEEVLEAFGMSAGAEDIGPFGPSLALALSVFDESLPSAADFLNSRMDAKVGRIEKRHVRMAAVVAGAVLLVLIGMVVSWKINISEVARLRGTLAGMQADIDAARDVVDKVSDARGWYGQRPRVLDCLRALTRVFPEEGRVWTSNLALSEEMTGIISGKANGEDSIIEVMDKMKKSDAFSDVQIIYMRDGGKDNQEVSFSMSFVFVEA